MRIFVKIIAVLGISLISLFSVRPVLAFPPLPSSFYGTVKVNGANVLDGTVIKALINGNVYAQTQTLTYQGDSVYALDVQGDDSSTTTIEGGKDGDSIVFTIGELTADQTGTWKSGTNINLNLGATTNATKPTPQNTPTSMPTQAVGTVALQDTPVPTITQAVTISVEQTVVLPTLQATSTPLTGVRVQVPTQSANPTKPSNADPGNARSSPSKYLVTIGIVVVACILFILLWLIFLRKPKV
jgi:hypothetical protein